MQGLDDAGALGIDSLGLIAGMADSATAFDEALSAAQATTQPFPAEAVANVAVCGMGGSAIAGDLVLGAYGERLRKPAAVVRDYSLPGWVGESTLVVLSSYSGATEETLTCAMDAIDRKALCVAITSGGKLGSFYGDQGVPVVPLPPGLQPRAALVRLLVPLLVVLERNGVLPPLEADLAEGRATLRAAIAAHGPGVPEQANPAKQLARGLLGGVPLLWGAELSAPVAVRWKSQINENAEVPAFASQLPELDHNEIVGFPGTPAGLRDLTRLVMLRDPRNHRQVQRRFDLTRELIEAHVGSVYTVTGEGQTPLARMLDLVMLGDYVSLYLALLRNVDPGPVEMIERLKERLATTGYGRAPAPEA